MIIYDVNWAAVTAGPSPFHNQRTEIFLFGCKKACDGNPCPGCFNSKLWDNSIATVTHTPEHVADMIMKHSPNKYISIGGGEPTDQMEELIELCKILHENEYHILLYTWKDLCNILFNKKHPEYKSFKRLVKYCNIIIDGQFELDNRKYKEDEKDGFFNSIGSSNQTIWSYEDNSKYTLIGYRMGALKHISLNEDNVLQYELRDDITVNQRKILIKGRKQ